MKHINTFLTAQDMEEEHGYRFPGNTNIGFNRRVYGHTYNEAFQYPHDYDSYGGWTLAEKLIDEGKIYSVHNFHSLDCKGGFAFYYGGTFVCNTCGGAHLDNDKWKIRVFKDGAAWCCVGLGFENLQESDNYAFGDSKNEVIENYWKVVNN